MSRFEMLMAALALALAVAGTQIGCRTAHLGPDTGTAYFEAIAAQRESQAAQPAMSAHDAKHVLHVHRTGETKAEASSGTGALITPMPLGTTSSGGGGMWPGASGNIQLEAK
jgi:hypothetical protein